MSSTPAHARLAMAARLGLVCVPSLVATALGCLLSEQGEVWRAIAVGGLVALPLALVGAVAIVFTTHRDFTRAIAAALLSLVVRIGGTAVALVLFKNHPNAVAILGTLAICLGLTLLMEMLGSVRGTRRPRAAHEESARA